MELNNLIPNRSENWVIKKNILTYKKLTHIPILKKESDFYYIFLDNRVKKEIIRLIIHLNRIKLKFYFVTPEYSKPGGVEDFYNKNIQHYLFCYIQPGFFKLFKKYNFDIIQNMVDWTIEFNCYNLIKTNYDIIKKILNKESFNYYNGNYTHDYPKEIIDEYNTLYREIQINRLLK